MYVHVYNMYVCMYACTYVVASSGSEVHSTMHPDPETDVSTVEFGSKEVYDILKAKGTLRYIIHIRIHMYICTTKLHHCKCNVTNYAAI